MQAKITGTGKEISTVIPGGGGLLSYGLDGGGKCLVRGCTDITGLRSLTPAGLFMLGGGARLPEPLTPCQEALRGDGSPQELLTARPETREDLKSPRRTCFPLPF